MMTRRAACGAAFLLFAPAPLTAQNLTREWSFEQIEEFLRTAKPGLPSSVSGGVTGSRRVTLEQDGVRHDAQIQYIDEYKPNYPAADGWDLDSYKFNIAAYRLGRLLGLDNIPVSVERTLRGKRGALTWWLDDVLMSEKTRYLTKTKPPESDRWNRQIYVVRVFDELIYNTDRNLGNLVITGDWKVWMIDHTRAFRLQHKLRNPEQLVRCERRFLEAMRGLDQAALAGELKGFLRRSEIEALLARRDLIVTYFDEQAAERGEDAVLYDLE